MDTGMDTIGVEHGLALLKDLARKRNKSVWLVSHRDELTNRVNSILKVVKENGFTSLRSAEE
jgi:ABC-type lipoprotein export system ATPase subunit